MVEIIKKAVLLVMVLNLYTIAFGNDLTVDFDQNQLTNLTTTNDKLSLSAYGDIKRWSAITGPSGVSVYYATSAYYNGYYYYIGGYGKTSAGDPSDHAIDKIWMIAKNDMAASSPWVELDTADKLPMPRYGHASLVINGRLYILGGSGTSDKTPVNTVWWAAINKTTGRLKADDTDTVWHSTTILPAALYQLKACYYEGYIYVVGGTNMSSTTVSTCYYAAVNPDGSIGSWQTATAGLPEELTGHALVQNQGRIYIVGGSGSGLSNDAVESVYVGTIDSVSHDITNWTSTASLPRPVMSADAVIEGGQIWVAGGIVSGTARAELYKGTIDRLSKLIPFLGQPGTWQVTTNMMEPRYGHTMIVRDGEMVILGGYYQDITGSGFLTNINTITTPQVSSTTTLFYSVYGEGAVKIWTGHTAILRTEPQTGSVFTTVPPTIFVIGGGSNTYNAFADGQHFSGASNPQMYATVYNSEVDSDGDLGTWAAPDTGGSIPLAMGVHMSTLCNGAIYVMGGANSINATIFADAPAGSVTAAGYLPPGGANEIAYGETYVYYEQLLSGSTGGTGPFEKTAPIPVFDPAYEYDTYGTVRGETVGSDPYPAVSVGTSLPIYQPLLRSAAASYNGYIYVVGGISRENNTWNAQSDPLTSTRHYETRVWYCRPNPGGTINDFGGPGGWVTTTPLISTVNAPTLAGLYDMALCVANERLYIFGGRDSVTMQPCNNVYYATINDDGTLGQWVEDTPMPVALAEHQVVFESGHFIVTGGVNSSGTKQDSIYYCVPYNSSSMMPSIPLPGVPGEWALSAAGLEQPVAGHQAVSYNGTVYVLGGRYSGSLNTSSAFRFNVVDIIEASSLVYSWAGYSDRFVDFGSDTMVNSLSWNEQLNSETATIKVRTATEAGNWSAWSTITSPYDIDQSIRYVNMVIDLETATNNRSGTANTPEISNISINYVAPQTPTATVTATMTATSTPEITPAIEFGSRQVIPFPNPGRDKVSFALKDTSVSQLKISIFNLSGELISTIEEETPDQTVLWQTQDIAPGIYIVHITYIKDDGQEEKIIKKVAIVK